MRSSTRLLGDGRLGGSTTGGHADGDGGSGVVAGGAAMTGVVGIVGRGGGGGGDGDGSVTLAAVSRLLQMGVIDAVVLLSTVSDTEG